MKSSHLAALLAVFAGASTLSGCRATPDYSRPLPEGWPALLPLGPDDPRPDFGAQWYERDELLPALERSIEWTKREHAQQFFPMEGVDHARALASLERFRAVLLDSEGPADFEQHLAREFTVYKSAGWDGRGGGVLFTGYFTPILEGALAADATHRWPLYALPPDLAKGQHGEILGRKLADGSLEPYPTRQAIEANSLLADQGLELVWLSDPLDAFIAHVNGSAFVRLADGSMLRLGYSGKNGHAYTSLGQELVKDGQLRRDEVSLPAIRTWAASHPELLDGYLQRNESYVFFTPIDGNPRGSLNLEVEAGRTLATDKTLFPRGALTFVEARLPDARGSEASYERFLLDQDTGGAIRTAGRADIYLGIGDEAGARAGRTRSEGQLYYLFLSGESFAAAQAGM
jgi:membrane-bound lytic murein transglycosylase A